MKGFAIYRINHDIRTIIELMLFYDRMKNTNEEYHQMFYFFDNLWDYKCPNPRGRCVAKWQNVKIHWLNGKYHRNPKEGPAFEWLNGTKEWYIEDQRHRLYGPAVERANGDKEWYNKGLRHRDDGPAVENVDGYKHWYFNGQLHRIKGPAVEYTNGYKAWYVKGQRHRDPNEGPAIEYSVVEYINGIRNEYWEFGNRVK